MLHGSKRQPVRKENELALACAEMRMVRWIYGLRQIDRYSKVVLRVKLVLDEDIISMLRRNRLRWYGHV